MPGSGEPEPGECLGQVLLLGLFTGSIQKRLETLLSSSILTGIQGNRAPDSWVRAPTHPHIPTASTDAEDVFWTEQGELTQQEMTNRRHRRMEVSDKSHRRGKRLVRPGGWIGRWGGSGQGGWQRDGGVRACLAPRKARIAVTRGPGARLPGGPPR